MDATRDHFERLFRTIGPSGAFRDAVAHAQLGLPRSVLPFSLLDGRLVERTVAALQLPDRAVLADIGCGFGAGGISIAARTGAALVGIDLAPSALTVAEKSARDAGVDARFVHALGEETGLAESSVDGVVTYHALMWMDPCAALAEIARIMRPGARLALTANEWTAEEKCDLPTVVRAYAPFVSAAGLAVEEDETIAPGYDDAFYAAMARHSAALREEMGDVADVLLDTPAVRRTRDRWIVARKPAE